MTAVREVWWLVLRSLLTRGRLAAIGAAAAVLLLLGLAAGARGGGGRQTVAYLLVNGAGIALLVPITALLFSSAALGDPVEDGTLVYLWLRPIPRWRIVGGAAAAAATVSLPLSVVPVAAAAVLAGGEASLVAGAAAAAAVAVLGYGGIFLGLGLVLKRAFAWGLAYVLIWEGVVAGIGSGPARLSVRLYAVSLLDAVAGRESSSLAVSGAAGAIVPVVIAIIGLAVTSLWLAQRDVQ